MSIHKRQEKRLLAWEASHSLGPSLEVTEAGGIGEGRNFQDTWADYNSAQWVGHSDSTPELRVFGTHDDVYGILNHRYR